MSELMAELGVHFDVAIAKHTDRIVAELQRAGTNQPVPATRAATVTAANNTPAVINLGRPAAGRAWQVLTVTVLGSDDHTALPAVYPTVYLGNPSGFDPSQCVVPANGQTVPNVSTFAPGTVWTRSDNLFVVVYGATAGQSLTAVARMLEYPSDVLFAGSL